jgi:putative lipoic acid-binding regulatory protein
MPITTMGARLVARLPAVVARQTYEDDSLSFRSQKSARTHHWHTVAISVAATHNPLLEYMHDALEQEHNGVPMLALAPEPEDLNKELGPTSTLPAPGGVANLALAFAMVMAYPFTRSSLER